jgi:hypothetical protein
MAFEKDTIALMIALQNMLPLKEDRQRVDELIKEELGHLLKLGSKLAQADTKPWRSDSLFSSPG